MGAHKTATTHLQHTLTNNQSRLLEHGVLFFGPPDLRGKNRKTINLALEGTYDPQDAAPPRRLVISDENLLGKAWSNDPNGPLFPFYPNPLARLEYFRHRFKGRKIKVALGLRNPATFMTSCYVQSIQGSVNGWDASWEDFKANRTLNDVRWCPIVQALNEDWIDEIFVWK